MPITASNRYQSWRDLLKSIYYTFYQQPGIFAFVGSFLFLFFSSCSFELNCSIFWKLTQSFFVDRATNMSVSVDKLYEAYARLDRHLKEKDYEAAVKTSKASTCQL